MKFATADDSATSLDAYIATSGTLTFAPGEQTNSITVQVKGDATPESDERFLVRLSNPTVASIADGEAIGTIKNDDAGGGGKPK